MTTSSKDSNVMCRLCPAWKLESLEKILSGLEDAIGNEPHRYYGVLIDHATEIRIDGACFWLNEIGFGTILSNTLMSAKIGKKVNVISENVEEKLNSICVATEHDKLGTRLKTIQEKINHYSL